MNWHQHRELLSRWQRTHGLALALNAAVKPGMRVLDAGCGTGILSLLAARLGAAAVVGVDLIDTAVAAELARENGLASRASFVRADLRELDPAAVGGPFDLLIGMIYFNDLRRDEAQSALALTLKERLLTADADLIPDRVDYAMSLWDWPDQDASTRAQDLTAFVGVLEAQLGLRLQTLSRRWHTEIDHRAFPVRELDGRLRRPNARQLSPWQPAMAVDYREGAIAYPPHCRIDVGQAGHATAVVWRQDLRYRDQLLFSNESVSWLEVPAAVRPGEALTVALDAHWRAANRLCRI